MISLANKPYERSPVEVVVDLKDGVGNPVVPVKLSYTVLRHNGGSWDVYYDNYKVSLPPQSKSSFYTGLLLKDGTEGKMRIVVEYTVLKKGNMYPFLEETEFQIINNPMTGVAAPVREADDGQPEASVVTEEKTVIKVVSAVQASGVLSSQPVCPEFTVTMNAPCSFSAGNFSFTGGENFITGTIVSTSSDGLSCTVKPSEQLSYQTDYALTVSGVRSDLGDLQSEAFSLQFSTELEFPVLQKSKELTVVRNGSYDIEPDEFYVGLAKVALDVNVPIEEESVAIITENGEFEIGANEPENIATRKINLTVDVQPSLEEKSLEITSDGSYTVRPSYGKYGLSSVKVSADTVSLFAYKCKAYEWFLTKEISGAGTYFGTSTLSSDKGKFKEYPIEIAEDGTPTYTVNDYTHHLIRTEEDDILRACRRGDLPTEAEEAVPEEVNEIISTEVNEEQASVPEPPETNIQENDTEGETNDKA